MPSVNSRVIPPEFWRLVQREIEDARQRAVEWLHSEGVPVAQTNMVPHIKRRSPKSKQKVLGRSGYCVGCGVTYDQETEGCKNCEARHGMRRFDARKKARRTLPPA